MGDTTQVCGVREGFPEVTFDMKSGLVRINVKGGEGHGIVF